MVAAIVVARILGRTTYGEFGIIQSTIAMFATVAGFGMGTTASKFVAEFRGKAPARAGSIIALSSVVSWSAGLLMAAVVVVIAPWLAKKSLAEPALTDTLRLSAVLLFLNSVNGGQMGVLTGFEAFKRTARVNLWGALLNFPLVAAGAYYFGVIGAITGMGMAQLGICLLSAQAVRAEVRNYNIPVRFSSWSTEASILWQFSLPAVLGSVLITPVTWMASSMLVRQPGGYEHVGALTAANQWFNALMWLPYVIGAVVLPMLAERFGVSDEKGSAKVLKVSIGLSAAATLPLAIVASLLSPFIMALYGQDFRSEWPTLAVSVFTAVIFAVQLPVGDLIAASSRMWIGFAMNLTWSAVFLGSTWLLIDYGSFGLASARLLAYVAQAIWSFVYAAIVLKEISSSGESATPFGSAHGVQGPPALPVSAMDSLEESTEKPAWFRSVPVRPRFEPRVHEPGFTVVIPTYNRAHLVHRAIESALSQTHPPRQILVIDDGSKDNTEEVCRKFGTAIEYVRQANTGVSGARNHGIKLARFQWTAFLDSDDFWTPAHLETVHHAIEDTSGKALFYFADMALPAGSDHATLWTRLNFKFSSPYLLKSDGTSWMLTPREPCSIQCSVFHTATLQTSGGFDTIFRVTEDRELFCRLGIGRPVCAVNSIGCIQTSDDTQTNRLTGVIHTRSRGFLDLECVLWRRLIDQFPEVPAQYRLAMHYNLAAAHWRLTRLHWHNGSKVDSTKHLFKTAAAQPGFLLWLIRHRRSDGWEKTLFPQCQAV